MADHLVRAELREQRRFPRSLHGDEQLGCQPRRLALLNVNIGLLGHVDSGKTSLARALSTELSTAALDKHPQSAVSFPRPSAMQHV